MPDGSKVGEVRWTIRPIEEDGGGLDVPVDDPPVVQIREPREHIARDAADLLVRHGPARLEDLRERERLEREDENVLGLAIAECLEEGDDGLVGEGLQRLDLADGVVGLWGVSVNYLEGVPAFRRSSRGGRGGRVVDG